MYPLSFVSGRDGNLPQCNYQLHETNSKLVRAMNIKLQELGGLGMADHYNKDSEQRNVTYLIEVRISYPQKIHLELHDLIPSIYRRTIPLDQLSQAQREYAARFNITPQNHEACGHPRLFASNNNRIGRLFGLVGTVRGPNS